MKRHRFGFLTLIFNIFCANNTFRHYTLRPLDCIVGGFPERHGTNSPIVGNCDLSREVSQPVYSIRFYIIVIVLSYNVCTRAERLRVKIITSLFSGSENFIRSRRVEFFAWPCTRERKCSANCRKSNAEFSLSILFDVDVSTVAFR